MPRNKQQVRDQERRVTALGEAGIIERVRLKGPTNEDLHVIHGVGDDCAVLAFTDEKDLLVTTDTMVEETHFTAGTLPGEALGWKVLAANISDVAAMGGTPKTAFLSLGLPRETTARFVDAFMAGLTDLARKTGVLLAGGDTVESRLGHVITLTLIGECPRGAAIYRHGARPGDDIWVSGCLGNAAGGLFVLKEGLSGEIRPSASLIMAHQKPMPRVKLGRKLAQSGLIHAMIDLSDGISTDLAHICRLSRLGSKLDQSAIPISGELRQLAESTGQDAEQWALHGGEDYELLFTAPKRNRRQIESLAVVNAEAPLCRVGTVVNKAGLFLVTKNGSTRLKPGGFSHLSQ